MQLADILVASTLRRHNLSLCGSVILWMTVSLSFVASVCVCACSCIGMFVCQGEWIAECTSAGVRFERRTGSIPMNYSKLPAIDPVVVMCT